LTARELDELDSLRRATLGFIFRKEIKEAWRTPGAGLALTGVALLTGVTVFSAVPAYRTTEAWKSDATRLVREQWITQGTRHPHSAAHYGIAAIRPLASSALLEPGVSAYVGQMLPLQTHVRGFPVYAPIEDASSAGRLSPLSSSLMALTLIPLLIILCGVRMLSGEREDGNLSLLLSSGTSPRALVAGKTAALAAIAALLITVKVVIEIAALLSAGLPVEWERVVGVQLVHAGYVAIWVCLVIGLSARVRSTQLALTIALSLWLVNSFVLPRAAASAGRLAVAEPSIDEFRAAIQHDISFNEDGTPWVNEWSKSLISETLEKYGAARIEDLPVGYAGIMLKGSDAHYEDVFEKHFTRLHQLHREQERWQHVISIAGPMLAARSLGQAFAGTDLTHVQHFSDAAERYRRLFVEATNHAIETKTTGTGWDLKADRAYWESIPAFDYQPPPPHWAVRQHEISLAVLALWLVAAGVWCARGHAHLRRIS
jgi:ABC-2 type transport system permease protein